MSTPLSVYLNDHHAGAHSALALIDRLLGEEATPWLAELRTDIEQDRQTLADVMRRLDIAESSVKKVSGWVGEQMVATKLAAESPHPAFRRMEAYELLSLGILGKQKLWLALIEAAAGYPALSGISLDQLFARAVDQHARVERERLLAARDALHPARSAKS